MMRIRKYSILLAMSFLTSSALPAQEQPGGTAVGPLVAPPPNIFQVPRLQAQHQQLMALMTQAVAQKNYAAMAQVCAEGVRLFPDNATWQYNLACAQSLQGLRQEALASLDKAVALGFRDVAAIEQDADLAAIKGSPEYAQIMAKARTLPPVTPPPAQSIAPAEIKDGIAWVTAANTAWNGQIGTLTAFFTFPEKSAAGALPILGNGKVGDLIREWHAAGTAAGNHGDLYDNRDDDHSNLAYQEFPQLARIEYDPAAKDNLVQRGIDCNILFNAPTFGNASLAGHRSLPRVQQIFPPKAIFSFLQYVNNHLYVYPEHRDHDTEADGGKGDTFPANTPYVIVSQGSSGSDQPFLNAIACTLAAFQPEVKRSLVQSKLLMPTVQMILRHNLASAGTPELYLTGKAHPTVFDATELNVMGMVTMAHAMKKEDIPPVVQIEAVEEDQPRQGIDYVDPIPVQKLLDTPCAIARVMRSLKRTFRIVVSAEKTADPNQRPLTFHWVVLRGDAARIRIKPLNPAGTRAELLIPHHERQPIYPGSAMISSRVDIGVFAHNGQHCSPPSFVSFYFLPNERRTYGKDDRIESVDYAAAQNEYVDSMLCTKKDWRDDYLYDEAGNLAGWKRTQAGSESFYTPDGAIVMSRDAQGRPQSSRPVTYVAKAVDETTSILSIEPQETRWHRYASPEDRIGTTMSREEYDRTAPK
jgi:hypothetical protein